MLNSERISICKALVKLSDYTNINKRKYNQKQGRFVETFNRDKGEIELGKILAHNFDSVKGANEIIQKLITALKDNVDCIGYISDLILLLEPTMTMSKINKALNKIQAHLTYSNIQSSMDKIRNVFMNYEWSSLIEFASVGVGVLNITVKRADCSLNDVIKAGMKGNVSPAKYTKLYSQFKNSYPYYKVHFNQSFPLTVSDVKDFITNIKHYRVGTLNDYKKAKRDLVSKAIKGQLI